MTINFAQKIQTGRRLTKAELQWIVGGQNSDPIIGNLENTHQLGESSNDVFYGDSGDNVLEGGNGNDVIDGLAGNDYMDGGIGDDLLIGGQGDDIAIGGEGNDTFVWNISNNGSDVFDGGSGNDQIQLDLSTGDTSYLSLQEAWENGGLTVELLDVNGIPMAISDEMWDENGNLDFNSDMSGMITGPGGEILNFTDVEVVTMA